MLKQKEVIQQRSKAGKVRGVKDDRELTEGERKSKKGKRRPVWRKERKFPDGRALGRIQTSKEKSQVGNPCKKFCSK